MTAQTILIVDDDAGLLQTLAILVRQLGHQPLTAPDVASAQRLLRQHEVDLVVTDLRMPGGSGLDLLEFVRRETPETGVIVLTAYGTVEGAVQAMQRGAADFVLKPFDAGEMEVRLTRALELRRMRRELENVIARAVVLCRGPVIGADLVDLRTPGAPATATPAGVRLDEALDRLEREMILRALDETKQVKARAARVLGISERSLWYKLRKHGLS